MVGATLGVALVPTKLPYEWAVDLCWLGGDVPGAFGFLEAAGENTEGSCVLSVLMVRLRMDSRVDCSLKQLVSTASYYRTRLEKSYLARTGWRTRPCPTPVEASSMLLDDVAWGRW